MRRGRFRFLPALAAAFCLTAALPGFGAETGNTPEDDKWIEDLDAGLPLDEEDEAFEEYLRQSGGGIFEEAWEISSERIEEPALDMGREEDGRLRYTFPNGNSFVTTVPRGMITSEPVELALSSGIDGMIMKDDGHWELTDSWSFSETGVYRLRLFCYQAVSGNIDDYNVYEITFTFTIIDPVDGSLGAVTAPEGFAITTVRRDGEACDVEYDNCFFLFGDGRYEIQYADRKNGKIHLQTVFTRDTTAPFLTFSQELTDGTAGAPLDFFPSEQNCRIRMSYEGEKADTTRQTLTAPGNYELTVSDAAGNERTYRVRIRQIFHFLDIRLIGAGVILLALAVWRLWYLRRHMTVL